VSVAASCRLTHVETLLLFGFFLEDLHALDLRAAGPPVHEANQPVDSVLLSLEHRLNGPVQTVRHPACHAMLLGESPQRIA